MLVAINSVLYRLQSALYSGNEIVEPVAPSCPSLNCTFSSYSSLAVCTSFTDVSSHLTLTGNRRFFSLSDKSFVEDGYNYFSATSTAPSNNITNGNPTSYPLKLSGSIVFKDATLPLADVLVIYPTGITNDKLTYGAVELIMQWCAQELTTEVVNGSAVTIRHKATRNSDPQSPGISVGGIYYSVPSNIHNSVSRFLDRLLQGRITRMSGI